MNFFRNQRRSRSTSRNQRDTQRASSSKKRSKSLEIVQPQVIKKPEDADDIAELERRVLEAKKVLEVMVKEKMKEKRRSSSNDDHKKSKKRSKKSRRDSSSD